MAGSLTAGLLLVALLIQRSTARGGASEETSSCIETWDGVLEGELSSPNFPSPYNSNDLCVWTIQAPDVTSRVVLTFKAFMLEESEGCQTDFVEIGEQTNSRMQHGQRLCGQQTRFQVVSKTNRMTVLFQSDSQNQFPGFRASFKVVPSSQVENVSKVYHDAPRRTKPANGSEAQVVQYDACKCGESATKSRRIVGGHEIEENKFPWLVVLVTPEHETAAHCGGVLITPKYVITAAHCMRGKTAESYRVVAGAYNLLTRDSESYAIRNVARLIPHEKYNRTSEEHDIGLVELAKDFDLSPAIQSICLPPPDLDDLVGEAAVTAGWGKVTYMGDSSFIPRAVEFPVVSNEECTRAFNGTDAIIKKSMLCAGVLDGTLDACQGDSGGPLMWFHKEIQRWQLIGVVSFGVRCATPGYYGVYTRVSKYIDWIDGHVGGLQCNSTQT